MEMKNNSKVAKQWCFYSLIGLLVFFTVLIACVNLQKVTYEAYQVDAGEEATFKMDVFLEPAEDRSSRLVISFCCPNDWNPRDAGNVRVWYESDIRNPGNPIEMSLIPVGESPKDAPGATWASRLWSQFGKGPNILDDMQWVTFWGGPDAIKNNEDMNLKITIKAKTSKQNLRAKLGFYVGHSDAGGTTDGAHYGLAWGDCFEVVNGEGDVIDFCQLQANMNQPGNATKNDIITIKYQGGIIDNDPLSNVNDIYLTATALTNNGKRYEKTNRGEESKMKKEGVFGRTFSISLWPAAYFGIPENEELVRIEYYFSNVDGSLKLMRQKISEDSEGNEIIENDFFGFSFQCK